MSRKIDTSREVRLWLGLALSAISTAAILMSNPYVKGKVEDGIDGVKEYVNRKKNERKERKEQKKWKKEHPDVEVVGSETIKQEL